MVWYVIIWYKNQLQGGSTQGDALPRLGLLGDYGDRSYGDGPYGDNGDGCYGDSGDDFNYWESDVVPYGSIHGNARPH